MQFMMLGMSCLAQVTMPVNGTRDSRHIIYVFRNANIVRSPGSIIQNATLVIRDEYIEEVGAGIAIPGNAVVYDMNGKWLYPSFVELDSEYGLIKTDEFQRQEGPRRPQYEKSRKNAFSWNEAVHPETSASETFQPDEKEAALMRSQGFGAVLCHKHDGIMRGSSVLVHTGDEGPNTSVLREVAAQHYSFSKGSSKQAYPSSQMGAIALIRQTLYDAKWYGNAAEKKEVNLSLEAINKADLLPVIFECEDYLSCLRACRIGSEFSEKYILKGGGDEYKRMDELKSWQAELIIPMTFPLPYDISGATDAIDLDLAKMYHWEAAPFNARMLYEAGITFALTGRGLKGGEIRKSLDAIRKTGLREKVILAALTTVPASYAGAGNELGRIEKGFRANFLILSDSLCSGESVMLEHWVNGRRYILDEGQSDIRGEYNLNVNRNGGLSLVISGAFEKPTANIVQGAKSIPVQLKRSGNEISMRYKTAEAAGYTLLTGNVNDADSRILVGKAQLPDGTWTDWAAIRQAGAKKNGDSLPTDTAKIKVPRIIFPMAAYGSDSIPVAETIIFKHATVWTNEAEGILEDADVCISGGKIRAIGRGLSPVALFGKEAAGVKVIDARGRHLTSGIIDEHSHIAISRGVNESGQAISAEVRIGDVIDCDDMDIYRQLAGGVTAAQLLHGSANPIGGQSALVKLRWGAGPEEMKIANAPAFIKFALGENVKQSNWGDLVRERYPQTRMGVEQVYYDAFMRATEYGEIKKIYESGLASKKQGKKAPQEQRVDLELEALLEILKGKRFITCHSYVQSEINMLMHVADSLKFRVNTFTHILEGYKIADRMKKHGASASTFSDWWAYKFEVNDAIPHNAAIMTKLGIATAINSDDAEMGRRLNQEAAKTCKYGGLSREQAWKTVTLNPAKMLHLDSTMGSIKTGKDADLVLWTHNPLSVQAKAEMTFVDGRCLFSRERDEALRKKISADRARLISKMADAISAGDGKGNVPPLKNRRYDCESESDEDGIY